MISGGNISSTEVSSFEFLVSRKEPADDNGGLVLSLKLRNLKLPTGASSHPGAGPAAFARPLEAPCPRTESSHSIRTAYSPRT